jgi:hypothetical protein
MPYDFSESPHGARIDLTVLTDRRSDEPRLSASFVERLEAQLRVWEECVAAWRVLDVGGLRIPNDHSDLQYDARVLEQLGEVSDAIKALMAEIVV